MIDLRKLNFVDHPENPLIQPPKGGPIIADPTVLPPSQSPDGKFHLWAHSLKGIHHFDSEDGIRWNWLQGPMFVGLRPYIFVEDGFHLFYERFERPWRTVIAVRSGTDLRSWSEPRTLARPVFAWEKKGPLSTNSNPCVIKHDGKYRLYFDGGWVWLHDCYYIEPNHIGYAESDLLLGPYEKHPTPIMSPDASVPWRNLGTGALRVFPPEGDMPWLALNNNLFIKPDGHTCSDIRIMQSDDGLNWQPASDKPIIEPEPGWKNAFVYAMCLAQHEDKIFVYYNARDGWFKGKERIGVAVAEVS